jgi:hypothetical protein
LTLAVAGTHAAGLSFLDSVREFFGYQAAPANENVKESPNAAFTPGNLVVLQIGDGSAALTAAATQVSLLEYTTSGSLVQGPIVVNSTGSSPRLTVTGTSGSEGHLVRSSDGNYVTLTGYDVTAGTAAGTFAVASVPRVIGRVNTAGTIDLTTAFNDGGTGAVRSAATTNGTDMWMTNSSVGLRYGPFGTVGASSSVAATPANTRVVKVFNGQLYMSSGSSPFSCINSVGTGTPTTGATTTAFPGMPCTNSPTTRSPYSFSISPAGTTMYVADDGTAANNGGIEKWTFDGTNWNNTYTLLNNGTTTTSVRGLTVDWSGGNPVIYATTTGTSANFLIAVTDTGAGSTAATIATSPTNTAFRGVDFTPGNVPVGTPTITSTATPTATGSHTPTSTATQTNTATPTNTATMTGTATNTATPTATQTPPAVPTFVISQVYGGGGATTGTPSYQYDYVEIKNISNTARSLSPLRLFYGSALGNFATSSSNALSLPDVTLSPGQYYLVQLGGAGTVGGAFPVTPDLVSGNLSMSATNGKVALVTTLLDENVCGATATPCDATQLSYIVDWVAWGAAGNGTAGNGEGGTSVNGGAAMDNTKGGVRKVFGCLDTNDNNDNFDVVVDPVPRNSASPVFNCANASPTPTHTPTGTPTNTSTPTPTGSPTNTSTPTPTQTPPPAHTLVISQVYGGGGGSTGTYLNDYVEIKNISNSAQSLNLLKLYYGSALGNFASSGGNEYFFPDGITLNPGQHYLIQTGSAGTGGAPLPVTPDQITTNLNLSASDGKVALVNGLLAENICGSTATPCDTTQLSYIYDWVAYGMAGNGVAGMGEGGTSVNNDVSMTNTQGGVRKVNGCQDTNDNNADFDVVTAPVPRNSTTTISCGGATATNTPTATATATNTPTATGTPGGASISGTITYGNAINNPPPPRFIRNVTVQSTAGSPPVGPVITGTPGTYTLTGFGSGNYTITPTKPSGPNTAVTSADAARVAQGVAGTNPFVSQNQRFAADTTGNGGPNPVSSQDAAFIARFAAGLTGFGRTGTWFFFVTGAPSPMPTAPATYNVSRSYTGPIGTLTGQDYVAVLVGEVSGNYNPALNARPAAPTTTTSVALPRLVTPADSEVLIPISVRDVAKKNVYSYEFDLRYDPSVIQPIENSADIAGTASRGLSVVTNPNEPGLLRVVTYGAYPINDDGLLMNLRFTAVGAPGTSSPLTIERIMFNEGDPGVLVTDGQVQLSSAPANQAEMTGRVLSSMGQGIPNARVILTDTTGATRSAISNGFGMYRFGNLTVGQTYTLSVESRNTQFTPLTVSVTGQSVNVDMTANQ